MRKPKEEVEAIESTKEVVEEVKEESVSDQFVQSELEMLHALYKTLKDLGINSIGDLEVKIARLQK